MLFVCMLRDDITVQVTLFSMLYFLLWPQGFLTVSDFFWNSVQHWALLGDG